MIIKEGFILKEIADTFIVVAVGQNAVDINGLITLNETGAFLWNQLTEEKTRGQLLNALIDEYDVDEDVAANDISEFLIKLRSVGIID
jgi:hypothetical protein